MQARLTALDNRLRQTERALVVERLARQTAEVVQRTWPAGVDAEEIGTLPMFSGDVDFSEQTDSVPWSQWSLTKSCETRKVSVRSLATSSCAFFSR